MKKADVEKLKHEISRKMSEVMKLMRRCADATKTGNETWFQVDNLPGGAVVIQAQALSPEHTLKLLWNLE